MTRHIGKDMALKCALGLLDHAADQKVRDHLLSCTRCHAMMEEAERSIGLIEGLTPLLTANLPTLPFRRPDRYRWLRMAAMLALGFALGVLASESLRSPAMTIVPQQITLTSPARTADGFVACDVIDVSARMH